MMGYTGWRENSANNLVTRVVVNMFVYRFVDCNQ